jgi:hypothetical protein
MRIAERQIWYLLNTLRDTLTIEGGIFSVSRESRLALYNDIINQQPNVIREFVDNTELCVVQQEGDEKGESNAVTEDDQ